MTRHDQRIPPDLDTMRPGAHLAAVLERVDVDRLSGHDRIVVLRARQRMASHYAALLMADIVAVSEAVEDDWEAEPLEAAHATIAELRAALNLTRQAADAELQMALNVCRRLPRVWRSLEAGDLDARRATAIAYNTVYLDDEVAQSVVDQIIDQAPDLTSGQIMARIRKLAIDAGPDEATRRYDSAVDDRRVVAEPTVDGTANLLGLDLPPDRVAAARRRINDLAKGLRGPGEVRTMDQLRADVLLDLLIGTNAHEGAGGTVDITIDLTTLAELDDKSGDLAGYGPIVADIARRVADEQRRARWRFIVTDPDTGRPAYTGLTRRRPSAGQRRQIEVRNPRCVFPGCRMPATESDLDHRIPWVERRETRASDMAPMCRYDHGIKHGAGWSYEFLPDGTVLWTSRLGHIYPNVEPEP